MKFSDPYGRQFKTLRVSLTEHCNLACLYCVSDSKTLSASSNTLTVEQYLKTISWIHQLCKLKTVRLTGGEPLLFKDLCRLVEGLRQMGIPEVKLTTNGIRLKSMASELKQAGITSMNISLDTLDDVVFKKISRSSFRLPDLIDAIDHTVAIRLPVKLNAVIIKGVNEFSILPLLRFAGERALVIRYLELMRMGYMQYHFNTSFFSQAEILEEIAQQETFIPLERHPGSTANYWVTTGLQTFGIIANESAPFCHDCHRLRLDSYGKLYGCLSNAQGMEVNQLPESQRPEVLQKAMEQKQIHKFIGSDLTMKFIGG